MIDVRVCHPLPLVTTTKQEEDWLYFCRCFKVGSLDLQNTFVFQY